MEVGKSGSFTKVALFLAVGYGVLLTLPIAHGYGINLPWEKQRTQEMAAVNTEQEVAAVKSAIDSFRRGMVERKPEVIMELSDPQLTFGHSNGVVQTREEFAEVVRSGAEIFKRVDLTNQNLVVTGSTAVERHHFSADIIYEGKLMNFELEVVEVWKKNADDWRLIARQAVKI